MRDLAYGVIPFMAIVLTLVGFHEFGHFAAARWLGLRVDEFAIGMGRRVLSRRSAGSGITYSVRMLPIGGFVKIAETGEGGLGTAPTAVKLAVYAAGPAMNVLLAFLASVALFACAGQRPWTLVVVGADQGTPAYRAGVRPGDRIVAFDDVAVDTLNELRVGLQLTPAGDGCTITVERGGRRFRYLAVPEDHRLMVTTGSAPEAAGFAEAVVDGFGSVAGTLGLYAKLPSLLLATGRSPIVTLSGPVAIASSAGAIAAGENPLWSLLAFAADVSLGIAVTNLLPVPVLDGGRMAMAAVEAMTRRKFPRQVERAMLVGSLALLGVVFVSITARDIMTLL